MAATTMNSAMSVDDLVSSFGASSIGQEARDLAALQAQLAATLFMQAPQHQHQHPFASSSSSMSPPSSSAMSPSSSTSNAFASSSSSRARTNSISLSIPVQVHSQRGRSAPARCTTPLARTPSASSSASFYDNTGMDEDSDERMVEDLLMPSPSPSSSLPYNSSYPQPSSYQPAPSYHPTSPTYHPSSTYPASPSSYPYYPQTGAEPESDIEADTDLFATTDPFFLAQVQAQQAAEAARVERQERLRAGMQGGGAFALGGMSGIAPPSAFGAGMGMGGFSSGAFGSGGFATARAGAF